MPHAISRARTKGLSAPLPDHSAYECSQLLGYADRERCLPRSLLHHKKKKMRKKKKRKITSHARENREMSLPSRKEVYTRSVNIRVSKYNSIEKMSDFFSRRGSPIEERSRSLSIVAPRAALVSLLSYTSDLSSVPIRPRSLVSPVSIVTLVLDEPWLPRTTRPRMARHTVRR